MEVDRTIQSRRVNYINNPRTAEKRGAPGIPFNNKQPRVYHIETFSDEGLMMMHDSEGNSHVDENGGEANFMREGLQACPI